MYVTEGKAWQWVQRGVRLHPRRWNPPGRHGRDNKPHCSCVNSPQFLPGQCPTNQ